MESGAAAPAATPTRPGTDGESLLVVRQLTRRFGDRTAVDDLSFEIGRGEIFGLLGPNGAGKSTTVNLLSTYLAPDRGEITIDGRSILAGLDVKRQIGVVPQEIALYDDLTALENLDFFARIYDLPRGERPARIREVLEQVGLADRAREPIRGFSGGMKRRLNLALGILHRPAFLMLDEPTVGVDPQSREKIFDIIHELQRAGTTLLYTTHYLEEAEQLCDRIAIMDGGRIVALGTLEELLRLRVEEIVTTRPRGLEQLFIQLTGKRLRD
ncbi:MAG: ABC transporter ATP-binding protein [Chloroflexota bacterium]